MIKLMKILLLFYLSAVPVLAASFSNIRVKNSNNQAIVEISLDKQPAYDYFQLHNPDRVVLDISQGLIIHGLPLKFSGQNIIKCIRTSRPKNNHNIRLVFELTRFAKIHAVPPRKSNRYNVMLIIDGTRPISRTAPVSTIKAMSNHTTVKTFDSTQKIRVTNSNAMMHSSKVGLTSNDTVIVAIDAGHGGQDPGATGQYGLHEKNVTIAIACKLKTLLNNDPMFKGVLTRRGNYFISVMGRSDVARKENANLLVSIHADSAPSHSATGASVWVLSNRRANSEMANWLEQREKQSELLGGAGDLLVNNQSDPYLSQALLDLQFGYSQRVGYGVAVKVLQELHRISPLHKLLPEHASLGVLRSPDIPSLLVETGFISNASEERLLGSSAYQEKIAMAIYRGLRNYFLAHPLQSFSRKKKRFFYSSPIAKKVAINKVKGTKKYTYIVPCHTVIRGETLSGIAAKYGVNIVILREINQLNRDMVLVGQRLNITVPSRNLRAARGLVAHKVIRGDSLVTISANDGISPQAKKSGQNLKIPASSNRLVR
ncbi:N-acetylmuramoyl-L-alanine amidase AmiB [Pantoea sp. Nvir]|uniref:N-acetylmuramoyl-L-alanine amidase AmiB n=1 Tax=Pantoea sp. Nvir TaxID=2576760 RepID=UPI0027EE5A25|nr:N-acetylmuramoyl-L-alanine amidase AmiB [Pantoea sp. Nvir]CAJ0990765.1 hypothetical protein NVIRPANT_00056 [Pantoea sp. Nvir]